MATVDDHKRRLKLTRGLSMSQLFPDSPKGTDKLFMEAFAQVAEKMIRTPEFILAVAELIYAGIPKPSDGEQGIKGEKGDPGDTGGKGDKGDKGDRGPVGKDGKQGERGLPGPAGKDGSPDTGAQIVSKINDLPTTPELQIDAKHIKNLPKDKEGTALHRGGLKLVWQVQLQGDINGINTVFTIPASQPEPKDGRLVISARGVLKDTDSGDFTVSGRTITFVSPPPSGSARPRAVIYHGK